MQPQKFDPTKNHGTVWGHAEAAFEQNGILYDALGEPLVAPEPGSPILKKGVSEKKDLRPEELFLVKILAGGPVMQANIKKDSEKEDLVWTDVLSAAVDMGIKKFKQGSANMWKLPEESA